MFKNEYITKIVDGFKEVVQVEDGKRSLIALGTCIGTGTASIIAYATKHKRESWCLSGISVASYLIGKHYANKFNTAVDNAITMDNIDDTEDSDGTDQNS